MNAFDWNDSALDKLRAYWAEGVSTAEIGRRMGVSKNAVVGKAHRLNLPTRPSPIRRDGVVSQRQRRARRTRGPTLAPLQTLSGAATLPPLVSVQERAPTVVRGVMQPRPGARVTPCCWPIGEPGTTAFRFCDVDAIAGRPYCHDHAALAYTKVRRQRTPEELAALVQQESRAARLRTAEAMAGIQRRDNGALP